MIPGRSIVATSLPGATKITVHGPSGPARAIVLRRDPPSDPRSPILDAHVVGETASVIVVVDTVQSRAGGMGYCQAGEEATVRVLALRPAAIVETAHWKLGSCIDEIEASAPPPRFADGTLTINWLHAPIAGKGPGVLHATIAADGSVTQRITPN